jgi:hypothetical protein
MKSSKNNNFPNRPVSSQPSKLRLEISGQRDEICNYFNVSSCSQNNANKRQISSPRVLHSARKQAPQHILQNHYSILTSDFKQHTNFPLSRSKSGSSVPHQKQALFQEPKTCSTLLNHLIQIPEILFHLQILILRHFRQTQRIILI